MISFILLCNFCMVNALVSFPRVTEFSWVTGNVYSFVSSMFCTT